MEGVEKHLLALTKEDIANFLDSRQCNPGGKHAYFRAIRAFYKWALDEEIIEQSPIDRMKAPKVPKPLRHKVSLDALEILLEATHNVRDKLIISMLADTGLRRRELASIQVKDIASTHQTVRIWGKGAKERVVRYGPRTAQLLTEYMGDVNPQGSLFGMNHEGISSMLYRLGKRLGVKCNPHSFRRTFATESVRNGVNVFYIQSLLGHESLTMTRIYAEQVNSEDAIKAYKPIVS